MSSLPGYYQYGFVGRAKECRQLGRLFEQSLEKGARMVLVGGDTGIGKTSLLEQLGSNVRARNGHFVVCKGGPLGSPFPYHPLAELLSLLIQDLGQGQVKETLSAYSPRILSELSVLVPRFATLFNSQAKGYTYREHLPDKLFVENASSIVRDLLRKSPVVLIIEDIPYADPTTIEVIQHFIQHSNEFPILICGTYDLDDIDLSGTRFSPFRNFVRALNHEENLTKITVPPFSEEETEEFLFSLLKAKVLPQGLVSTIYRKSEGNPLVIKHMLDKFMSCGSLQQLEQGWSFLGPPEISLPEEISEMFLIRLEGIKPELRCVLGTAAVIGRRFSLDYLVQLLNTSMAELLPQLEEAIKHKLIEEHQDPDGYYFTFGSSRLQEVLYENISYQRKTILHEQIGLLLEKTMDPRVQPDEFAYHFHWGEDKEKAVKYAIMAGQRAKSLYAFHSARQYFCSARDLFPLLERSALEQYEYPVLEGLAESSAFLGYYSEAWKCLGQMLGTCVPKGSCEYASVQIKVGQVCYRMGNYTQSLEHYNLALESGTDEQKHMATCGIIMAYLQMGSLEEAQSLAELELNRAEKAGDFEILQETYAIMSNLHLQFGEGQKAHEYGLKISTATEVHSLKRLTNMIVLGQLALETGPCSEAEALLAQGLNLAAKIHDPVRIGQVRYLFAKLHMLQGDFYKAREVIERVKCQEVYPYSFILKANISHLETVLTVLGESSSDSKNLAEELGLIWEGRTNSGSGVSALACMAGLSAMHGETERSINLLSQASEVQSRFPTPRNRVHLARTAALLELTQGKKEEARLRVCELLKQCEEHGMMCEAIIICRLWPDLVDVHCRQVMFTKFGIEVKTETTSVDKGSAGGHVVLAHCLPKEVSLVLDFIHCQFASDVNIASLCQVAALSERQLRRLFTRYTGVNIKEYINSYRVARARELLLNPTMGISQVGELVGLADKSHFCKTFKALVGVSPSEYRKSQLENVRLAQQTSK